MFVFLYIGNISGWLMDDDEGAAFYEAWQLAEQKQAGVDFIAENQPLFLISGSQLIHLFGHDPTPLRLLSALQVLVGTFLLAIVVYKLFGGLTAVLTLGFVLFSGLVYPQARIFRPDAMMLGWEMAALAAVFVAVKDRRDWWWSVAGACYGTAILWKLFGLIPVLGLIFYFIYWWYRDRAAWRSIIRSGLFFSLPFLLVALVGSLLLYNQTGFYYAEAFTYHIQMEQNVGFFLRAGRNILVLLLFFWPGLLFLAIAPLWFINRHIAWSQPEIIRVLLAQVATVIIFPFITRPVHIRYFLYLVPVMAVLLAWQLTIMWTQIKKQTFYREWYAYVFVVIVIGLTLWMSQPNLLEQFLRRETGTIALANYVAMHTQSGDAVLSDYATINFLADRPSVYEASIIAGGQIESGAVTGDRLIKSIEDRQVQMVLLHVEGGDPFPHQLVALHDYNQFRTYLTDHFDLTETFDRNGQMIEIFQRP